MSYPPSEQMLKSHLDNVRQAIFSANEGRLGQLFRLDLGKGIPLDKGPKAKMGGILYSEKVRCLRPVSFISLPLYSFPFPPSLHPTLQHRRNLTLFVLGVIRHPLSRRPYADHISLPVITISPMGNAN
jgi:hypothetical protein